MALTNKLRKRPPTKATVRRAQLITTYGVGSILPVESESFMVAGLEAWLPRPQDAIDEPRLCASLGVRNLYTPPGGDGGGMVPMVRFPEWVSCPTCSRLDKFWRLADKPKDQYVNRCRHCLTVRLVPSRFVACCVSGHIQDFPYMSWVHRGSDRSAEDTRHSLRLSTDPRSSTLAGITVTCTCGASRTLEGALGRGALGQRCGGRSPWLDTPKDECAEGLVGLQRGASNVWFADVQSALTVDRSMTKAEQLLERIRPELHGIPDTDMKVMLGIKARQHGVDESSLIDAFYKAEQTPTDRGDALRALRHDEYEALARLHPEIDGSETFVCSPTMVGADDGVGRLLDLVSQVPKLREVRALRGFGRVVAPSRESGGARGRLSGARPDWLPAIEVLGEGVFVRLREDSLVGWEQSVFALGRAERLTHAMRVATPDWAEGAEAVSPRLLLLHSLSHILLSELALDTGYPASSIRERLYAEHGQSGILLYTATADAAGSLGGLCAQGTVDNIRAILESAAERAQWCSADPVCLESTATGAGARNLAACHSCLLIPEVSCELQNGLLDRASLVGTESEPAAGFLHRLAN